MKNLIMLKRRNAIIVNKKENPNEALTDIEILTMVKNFESIGYLLSPDLIDAISNVDGTEAISIYEETLSNLRTLVGAHVTHTLLCPNFPTAVMDDDDGETYMNALRHYLSGGEWLPRVSEENKTELNGDYKLKPIGLAEGIELVGLCRNLLSSRTSISESDMNEVRWIFNKYNDVIKALVPEDIPFKENLAFVTSLIVELKKDENIEVIIDLVSSALKTSTDVLRYAVAISGGDISLADNSKFKRFTRRERRIILGALNNTKNSEEDMFRFEQKWKRLSSVLHPFEYKKQYPNSAKYFKALIDGTVVTFNGAVEKEFKSKNSDNLIKLLSKRPGEFARRLDRTLRTFKDDEAFIVSEFEKVAPLVASPLLLQLRTHFMYRNEAKDIRPVFPKGNVAKAYGLKVDVDIISDDICETIVIICGKALLKHYEKRDSLGKTFIDPLLKNYLVPFSQRSANDSAVTIIRGSKLPIEDNTSTIRAFIHWKNSDEVIDLDLSVAVYDENWKFVTQVSYTRTSDEGMNIYHSGDITNAPLGASEMIDLDIESLLSNGARYAVFNVYSFSHQCLSDIPECFFGWMERENLNSGEPFEAKTVRNKADLISSSTNCVPVIFDALTKTVIWADMTAPKMFKDGLESIENTHLGVADTCKAIVEMKKATMYDVVLLNATARGTLVTSKSDAESIFSVDEGITPFDFDKIISDLI